MYVLLDLHFTQVKSRWWFQIFFIFTPKIGEDEPILTNIFQMGWNHQLVVTKFRQNYPGLVGFQRAG